MSDLDPELKQRFDALDSPQKLALIQALATSKQARQERVQMVQTICGTAFAAFIVYVIGKAFGWL